MALVFVTGNPGKLQEARVALGGLVQIEQDDQGYPEIQADSLQEVARAGLESVAQRREPPFFLEDAGLFIDALSGFPGVYSAQAYQTLGCPGILRLLADTPKEQRTARFEAVIGYRDRDHRDHLLTGTTPGRIQSHESGDQGFGFDPIFTPDALATGGDGPSFAELTPHEKNRLSHRGQALEKLRRLLEKTGAPTATPAAHEKDS